MSGGARGPQSQEEKGVALIEMREKRVVLIEKQRSRRLYVHGCSAPDSYRQTREVNLWTVRKKKMFATIMTYDMGSVLVNIMGTVRVCHSFREEFEEFVDVRSSLLNSFR